MPFKKRLSQRRIIVILPIVSVILIFLYLTYFFPTSRIGQTYLGHKAERKYIANFYQLNLNLNKLPKNQATYYAGPFCSDLSLHELDTDEHGWIEYCSVTKVLYFDVAKAGNLKETLNLVDKQLGSEGWKFQNLPNETKLSEMAAALNKSSTYRKNEPHSKSCYMNFFYEGSSAGLSPTTLTVTETCDYYYRSVLDL